MTATKTRTIQNKIRMSRADKAEVIANAAAGAPYTVIGRFVGVATGFKVHTGQYGDSFGLEGTFGFVDAKNGELEEARAAWGPALVIDPVVDALKAGAASVKVGPVDIIAKVNGRGDGVVYGLITHEPVDTSPIAAMLQGLEPLKIAGTAQVPLALEEPTEPAKADAETKKAKKA